MPRLMEITPSPSKAARTIRRGYIRVKNSHRSARGQKGNEVVKTADLAVQQACISKTLRTCVAGVKPEPLTITVKGLLTLPATIGLG